jgi:hypothetical protein
MNIWPSPGTYDNVHIVTGDRNKSTESSYMAAKRLLNIKALSREKELTERQIRTLYQTGKIPYMKVGHRTVLFDPEKVMAALERFEIKAVGT